MTSRFLADACALVDYLLEPAGIMTAVGREAMEAEVLVSPISLWELTRKSALGKLAVLPRVDGSFAAYLVSRGFVPLPLTWADAERANALPPVHKDPIDRLLIAQALHAGLAIITNDRLFEACGVRTVW